MDIAINYVAVVAAAAANMVVGFLWYGPLLGKQWMHEMGFTREKIEGMAAKGMSVTYTLQAVGALMMAYVLAHVLGISAQAFGSLTTTGALTGAFWMWLGFVAPVLLGVVLWEGKSWKLYAIQAGYFLVTLEVMAAVLTLPLWG